MAEAQVSRLIAAAPDKVWKTLTSREGMKAYMMGADVEADWRIGGQIRMQGEYQGKRFEDRGEVRSFEPERKLAYTHESGAAPGQAHLVTFELKPRGDATEVTVTQAAANGGEHPDHAKNKAMYEKTWASMLESLEKAVQ
ncbi:SRPBCC domain-containing protein [Phenylobacterium sp.]|uniref:SRPBCC family protein n=1 Tax=Phenylobacterium sp. TaxID=1871053 RepID=UPI002DF22E7A|nr:SRPBCC domain-containing protein [Phenylobacterium sp.]